MIRPYVLYDAAVNSLSASGFLLVDSAIKGTPRRKLAMKAHKSRSHQFRLRCARLFESPWRKRFLNKSQLLNHLLLSRQMANDALRLELGITLSWLGRSSKVELDHSRLRHSVEPRWRNRETTFFVQHLGRAASLRTRSSSDS